MDKKEFAWTRDGTPVQVSLLRVRKNFLKKLIFDPNGLKKSLLGLGQKLSRS